MEIYFLRHGRAEGNARSGRDEDRSLTPEGKTLVEGLAKRLAQMGVRFEGVLTSPFARARQTAEIVAKGTAAPQPQAEERLASGSSVDKILAIPLDHTDLKSLLLVGHMPDFGEALGALLKTTRSLALSPGTICQVTIDVPFAHGATATLGLYLEAEKAQKS